ncbi:MAG: ATP-binding cassette domain-containing protein [Lachnospiraceae bacterium]|jgi:ABC-2 type transport system ATP-binding protein|nr:ATP-binding cassette domain-containing protein [Lachnospiraceae bacterium]
MSQIVLQTHSISKHYGTTCAVDNVNIVIKKGDIYGLIGRNGAGKTTLIRMITALTFASSGELSLFGQTSASGLNAARCRMGSVVEIPALYPHLSARQNLEYYRKLRGIPNKSAVDEALTAVNLMDTDKKKFRNFSLGMKQRLGLALALLSNPDFIILDEPTNGLDPMGIVEMREMIKRLRTDRGITFMISSHILSELSLIATRYGIIHDGKMIKELTDAELREKCQRCLSIKVDDTKKAAVVLETVLNTTMYKVLSNNEIRLYDYFDNIAEVPLALNTHGVRVSALTEINDNLEDYFMSLIEAVTPANGGKKDA